MNLFLHREQTAATSAGKKPEIVEKMILGKLAKKLGEICLLDQVNRTSF
jgi:translation elongation factor EF-Ts